LTLHENTVKSRCHMNPEETLIKQLDTREYKARVVSIQRLRDLRKMIDDFNDQGLLSKKLYDMYFTDFLSSPPEDSPDAQSLIVVAKKDPPSRFTFHHNKKTIHTVVPPTYLHGREKIDQTCTLLTDLLKPHGFRVVKVNVPNKLLGVCSGLAEYGKNNIAYVEGLGSFHRLTAFYSDLPCDDNQWRQPVMMEQCMECDKCMRSCPTGAIRTDRFLLNTERCITFWNEHPPDVDFPEWLKPAWHNSLIGCMICQKVCPANHDLQDWLEPGADFSEEETNILLNGLPIDEIPQTMKDKLEESDLIGIVEILPRNLRVLLK